MKIRKRYISEGDTFWNIPDDEIVFVGGKEGVFATWTRENLVFLAGGDDGNWWEIACYDKFWIPQIIEALKRAGRSGSYPEARVRFPSGPPRMTYAQRE